MPKLNLSQIRTRNNRVLKQYENYGVKVFRKALIEQATNPDPKIMTDAYLAFYERVFVDSAKREYNRIRMQEKSFIPNSFFLATWKAWIRDWVIINLGDLITKVNQNTLEQIKLVLGDAIEQGLNPFQTEKLLRKEIGSKTRATAIARTESTRANNMGKERSATEWANETGTVLWKLWVWSGSKEPRIEHMNLQNKPIPKDSFFIGINGKPMSKPGDLSGGPENTINCSCTVVYISERFARKNYPESFGLQPIKPVQISNQTIITGDQRFIEKYRDVISKSISDLGIENQVTVNFVEKTSGNARGSVGWKNMGDFRAINNNVIIRTTGDHIEQTIKHELRHVYQGEKMGFIIRDGWLYFEGKAIMSTTRYASIMKGTSSRSRSVFEKSIKSYFNLPWEKDADDFAGILRNQKSIAVDEFYIVDLIQLPYDILSEIESESFS